MAGDLNVTGLFALLVRKQISFS